MITQNDVFLLQDRVEKLSEKVNETEETGEYDRAQKDILNSCLILLITLEDMIG